MPRSNYTQRERRSRKPFRITNCSYRRAAAPRLTMLSERRSRRRRDNRPGSPRRAPRRSIARTPPGLDRRIRLRRIVRAKASSAAKWKQSLGRSRPDRREPGRTRRPCGRPAYQTRFEIRPARARTPAAAPRLPRLSAGRPFGTARAPRFQRATWSGSGAGVYSQSAARNRSAQQRRRSCGTSPLTCAKQWSPALATG
jgi:hypothetical protein